MHAPTLNKNVTRVVYKYPVLFCKQGDISIKAVGWQTVGEWGFTLKAQTRCTVKSSQWRRLRYPTGRRLTHRYPKLKIEPQESSSRPGGQGPSANCLLWSQCPTGVQTTGVSHRKGWGGPGGGETPLHLVVMPTASSYVPFHITQALVNVAGRC